MSTFPSAKVIPHCFQVISPKKRGSSFKEVKPLNVCEAGPSFYTAVLCHVFAWRQKVFYPLRSKSNAVSESLCTFFSWALTEKSTVCCVRSDSCHRLHPSTRHRLTIDTKCTNSYQGTRLSSARRGRHHRTTRRQKRQAGHPLPPAQGKVHPASQDPPETPASSQRTPNMASTGGGSGLGNYCQRRMGKQ